MTSARLIVLIVAFAGVRSQAPPASPGASGGGAAAGGSSCTDTNLLCQWWSHSGECQKNAQWMQQNCAGSCNPTTCPSVTVQITAQCQDDPATTQCATWSASGECNNNKDYMLWKCTKTCNFCAGGAPAAGAPSAGGAPAPGAQETTVASVPAATTVSVQGSSSAPAAGGAASGAGSQCTDTNLLCQWWSHSGECQSNAQWMQQNCAGSCNPTTCPQVTVQVSGQCQDDPATTQCATWSASGECTKNPDYMLWKCAKTCGKCTSTSG